MTGDELEEAQFWGIWYRWSCPGCEEMNETQEDIRGTEVECDECGMTSCVTGN